MTEIKKSKVISGEVGAVRTEKISLVKVKEILRLCIRKKCYYRIRFLKNHGERSGNYIGDSLVAPSWSVQYSSYTISTNLEKLLPTFVDEFKGPFCLELDYSKEIEKGGCIVVDAYSYVLSI